LIFSLYIVAWMVYQQLRVLWGYVIADPGQPFYMAEPDFPYSNKFLIFIIEVHFELEFQ